MLIVDTQVHIWAASTPERPWPARHEPHKPQPFSKDDLLVEMDQAGVHRVLIAPPSWEGDRNDLALEAARLHPDRFAVVGPLDLQSSASHGLVATWRQQPGMLGLRLALRRGVFRSLLSDGHLNWLWAEAEKAGVPVMVALDPDQLHFIDQISERHPQLKVVIGHLCLHAGAKDDAAFADLDKLLQLAPRRSIAVNATSLPSYTSDSYPFHRLHPYLRRVYDAFGPKRIFWGTDLTRLACSYRQAITMMTEEIEWLTDDDKEWIMGRGVCEWLGWKLPPA